MLNPGAKVYRATVVNSSDQTGEIYVQLGAFGITSNTIAVSFIDRYPVNGRWKVPDPGEQVYISADDDSLTNPVLLDTVSSDVYATGDPTGHEDKSKSTVSFSDATRTFTITPNAPAHYVWVKGKRFTKTVAESVQLPDILPLLYFIYYDYQGVLKYRAGFQVTWGEEAPVAYIYWNPDNARHEFFADERHGVTMDWQSHEYLHRTRGAALASGFDAYNFTTTTSGNAATDADAQIGLFGGTFFDEDLQVDITHSASPTPFTWQQRLETTAYIPIYFLNTSGWTRDTATAFPLKQGIALPKYNLNLSGVFSTPDLSSNKFGITWVVATNGLGGPVLGILGQGEYNNIGEAEAATWSGLTLTAFPVVELRPLYKVVYQVGSTYTNTPKAVIRGVYDIRREVPSTTGIGVQVTDHGALTGLADDDHTQYYNQTRGDARYLQLTGGSVTGPLYVSGNVTGAAITGASVTSSSVLSSNTLSVSGSSTLTGAITASSTASVSGVLTASSGINFPNTTNLGIQNVAGTSYLHLDRTTGSAQWKTKVGASAFIDADTLNIRSSAGSTYAIIASTGASVNQNVNLTLSGNPTSSLVNNAGALELKGGTNVVLFPAASSRIVTGRGKNTWQMTGFSALRPSTDVTITNSGAVLLTGISFTSMQAGDILDIRAVLRMQRITTDSSLTMYIEVVGPNGTSTLDERIIYADASVTSNLDHTMSGAWFYTCNQGDGTYTVRLSGYAFVSNVWKLLATDTDSGIYAASYSMR